MRMENTKQPKKKFDTKAFRRVLALAMPHKSLFMLCGILALIVAPLSALRPYLIERMVDDHIFKFDVTGLTNLAILFVLILVVEAALDYYFSYSTAQLGQSIVRDLRLQTFQHITDLKLGYFDKTPVGTNTTRTISDIETINSVFSEGIITIISDILSIIVVLGVMLWTSWKLTLVTVSVFPVLIWASYYFKEYVKNSFQTVRTAVANMNSFLQERITGMRIVQIFNAEEQEMDKFKKINRIYTQANIDSIFAYAVFFPVVEVISAAALGLMVWYGARGVIDGEVTLGTLVAFPVYINMLFRPIRVIADKFNTLQMGLVAAERVFALLDNNEKIPNTGTLKPKTLKGNIDFKNVSFAYNDENYVLKNINFHVKEGQTLAIVGSTGSGKSTIINLLSRFYDIQKGTICIGENNLKDFDLHALRRHIAVVLQDVFLFSGSVLENITLRDSNVSRETVIEAAKMIGAHEFIEKLPNGYDYQVMERGATLSMGQRQLISFVRALISNPEILVLDEATSSIDPETEQVIQFAIEKLIAKRTSIIIAHRFSTIRHANNVLVLDRGEVREYGTHDELMQLEGGRYRELYEMQFASVMENL
jgi:ATP-binding cassette, subfamily B, multidrug efflux pump